MRRRILIVFLLMVLAPLGAVAWLGFRLERDERQLVRHRFDTIHQERLHDLEAAVGRTVEEIERGFLKRTELSAGKEGSSGWNGSVDSLRELARTEPLFRQVFLLGVDGVLIFPSPQGDLSRGERAFLERTQPIWLRDAVLYAPPGFQAESATAAPRATGRGDSLLGLAARSQHGWITWYWEEGLHLLFWRALPKGGVIGAEVERVALLARIIGRLPETELEEGGIALTDARGDPIYHWGPFEPDPGQRAAISLPVAYPLDFLKLEYFAPEGAEAGFGGSARLGFLLGLSALLFALLGLSAYFYREYTRDLREASQRVSFVTQVSHELKTPLTNIRLYAELLEDEIEDLGDDRTKKRLSVIVSESQRLTRLINNILTFSKQKQNTLRIDRAPVEIDPLVRAVLGQFGPLLEAKGVEAKARLNAPRPVLGDADALGQILANLLSNVEKYAAEGRMVEIETSQNDRTTSVKVTDHGPGIAALHRERVFQPFYRVSSKLTDGVTGTGIGLTIARELARLQGGDLVLLARERGACFELRIDGGSR